MPAQPPPQCRSATTAQGPSIPPDQQAPETLPHRDQSAPSTGVGPVDSQGACSVGSGRLFRQKRKWLQIANTVSKTAAPAPSIQAGTGPFCRRRPCFCPESGFFFSPHRSVRRDLVARVRVCVLDPPIPAFSRRACTFSPPVAPVGSRSCAFPRLPISSLIDNLYSRMEHTMMIGSTAVAGRPSRPSGGRRSGPTTGAAEPIPPQGCEICEWARQCGSRVWECDACGRRRDFRAGAQLELLRGDDEPNVDRRRK